MNLRKKNYLILDYLIINLLIILIKSSSVTRPRGVSLTNKIFYDPNKDFSCIDGSSVIPFKYINDDYCDCADGSDEPGTSACLNGIFHCVNAGYIEKEIHSSFVNDGICDCCDGSDEWSSNASCVNNCFELGEVQREELRKKLELFTQGNEIRKQFIKEANQKKLGVEQEIQKLKEELNQLENEKREKELLKQDTDQLEKQVLDKHNEKLEQLKKLHEQNRTNSQDPINNDEIKDYVLALFNELDLNKDGSLSYFEIMTNLKFDQNDDGLVTEDEAKKLLDGKESINLDEYVSNIWINFKPYIDQNKKNLDYNKQKDQVEDHLDQNVNNPETEADLDIESNDNLESHDYTDDIPNDLQENHDKLSKSNLPDNEINLEYDEETKQIIEKAKENRDQFNSIQQKFNSIQNKINELEKLLNNDYGLEGEFWVLQGNCFELSDREYVYKLCPFGKATQKAINGVDEVHLGRWGYWNSPTNNKYSSFRFDQGTVCWNGPARSVDVKIYCGLENKLISVNEPNRCEYAFEFTTPAACVLDTLDQEYKHTEL